MPFSPLFYWGLPIVLLTISTGATMNCTPQPCCWLADPGAIIHRQDEKPLWGQNSGHGYLGLRRFLASFSLFNYIDLVRFLQGVDFQLGEVHFSLFQVIRAFFLLLALYWVSKNLRIFFHFWLTIKSGSTPAVQILFYGSAAFFSLPPVSSLSYITWGSISPSSPFSAAPWDLGWVSACKKSLPTWRAVLSFWGTKSPLRPGDGGELEWERVPLDQFPGKPLVSVVTQEHIEHLILNEKLVTRRSDQLVFSVITLSA